MIKVHCFVSCVCEVIKRTAGVDHRPFYFGVWDADFTINDQCQLSYHSENTSHDFFKTWYQELYGVEIKPWYDEAKTKADNLATLVEMIENKPESRNIMVMLDMFHLPERENKFNQNPFPHYVMLERFCDDNGDDPDVWFMWDPDFRWEGPLPKDRILNAIDQPSVGGGYYFDGVDIRHTTDDTVRAYFAQCMKHNSNPFTDAIRSIVKAHVEQDDLAISGLQAALREVPVMSIRKYAYEHAFAFFWEALGLDEDEFEHWCDEIEKLEKTFTVIQFRAMKLAMTGKPELAEQIYSLLDQQDAREFKIKTMLQQTFERWSESREAGVEPVGAMKKAS